MSAGWTESGGRETGRVGPRAASPAAGTGRARGAGAVGLAGGGRPGGALAYTTVITILTRLLAKGAVTRERAGRSFVWTPASDHAGLAAHKMRKVLDAETDREAVLASFVTGLDPDDERLLRELL